MDVIDQSQIVEGYQFDVFIGRRLGWTRLSGGPDDGSNVVGRRGSTFATIDDVPNRNLVAGFELRFFDWETVQPQSVPTTEVANDNPLVRNPHAAVPSRDLRQIDPNIALGMSANQQNRTLQCDNRGGARINGNGDQAAGHPHSPAFAFESGSWRSATTCPDGESAFSPSLL